MISALFGHFGEWPTRLTTLIFLGLFSWTVYISSRKHFDRLTSVSLAFMLLTSGRILFWDSMLGLIDICFSWIVFINFMVLFHLGKAGRWKWMFILSYFLCSICFLLKGLPAAVFQVISIITALVFYGAFRRKIVSPDHAVGIAVGLLPMLIYYVLYARQVSLENVFSVLWDQSLQRTGAHHGFLKTIVHAFTFPFEQLYHFLPWSLLIVTFFHPRARQWIRNNPFIHFSFWMLITNIPVYWLSVQVYPRYLLMFLPLFNVIGLYMLQQTLQINHQWWRTFHIGFAILTGIVALLILLIPLDSRTNGLHNIIFIWIAGSAMILFCFLGVLLDARRMFIWIPIALLVARSVFNLVVVPVRSMSSVENNCREDCRRLAANHRDKTLYIFGKTETHQVARFYTANFSQQIIRKTVTADDTAALYLVDLKLYPEFPGKQIDSLLLERGQKIALMEIYQH
jgi:4-amino-4-deoxy-L-arabinose transferase-like glycosyltransferase